MEKKTIECLNCGEVYEFKGTSKDELGWHVYHDRCKSSYDVDINEYLVPRGTKVKVNNDWVGIVDGCDEEDTNEFESINYWVCPIEFTNEKVWTHYYAWLLRSEFEII